MLETFTIETFAGHLGEPFRLRLNGRESLTLSLAAATPYGVAEAAREGHRAPFSLLFHGPRTTQLPQRIYHLEHESIGAFEIFLVPVGLTPEALQYEAIFN